MHVSSANAARLKLHKHPSAFKFRFWDVFDFDVAGSMVNCGFQKESTLIIEWLSVGY